MNQSTIEARQIAFELGGTEFLEFYDNTPSENMPSIIFPKIAEMGESGANERQMTLFARTLDKAYMIGIYEAWKRLR